VAPARARRAACPVTSSVMRGAVRDQAAFPEFPAADDQQRAAGVDIAQAQAACLACPQPEPVAQGEDGPVGRAAPGGTRVVRQRGRSVE